MHLYLEPASHLGLQVHRSPADHAMDLRIGPAITSSNNSALCGSLKAGARPGGRRDFRPSTPAAL